MSHIRWFILVFLLPASLVRADSLENGTLFGYTIGDQYPVTAATQHYAATSGWFTEIVADHPEQPDDLGPVHLLATVKSKTIVSIWAETIVHSIEAADVLATKYQKLFTQRTGNPGTDKTDDYQRYRARLDDRYALTVNVVMLDDRSGLKIMVGLKDDRGDTSPLVLLAKEEWDAEMEQWRKKRSSGPEPQPGQ